jgi:hypothetical protein
LSLSQKPLKIEEICQHTTERFSQSIQQNSTSKLDKKNVLDKIAKKNMAHQYLIKMNTAKNCITIG